MPGLFSKYFAAVRKGTEDLLMPSLEQRRSRSSLTPSLFRKDGWFRQPAALITCSVSRLAYDLLREKICLAVSGEAPPQPGLGCCLRPLSCFAGEQLPKAHPPGTPTLWSGARLLFSVSAVPCIRSRGRCRV